jgi:alpha-D-ribose 1-methylphosphonate 5-triphosphate synthase subunit PhnL
MLSDLIRKIKKYLRRDQQVFHSNSRKILALVKDIKKGYALLNMQGRDILAKVDIPVKKGEYLLLQFKGLHGEKHLFKVLERSYEPFNDGNRSIPLDKKV